MVVVAGDKRKSLTLNTTHPRKHLRPNSPPRTRHHIQSKYLVVIMAAVICKMFSISCSEYVSEMTSRTKRRVAGVSPDVACGAELILKQLCPTSLMELRLVSAFTQHFCKSLISCGSSLNCGVCFRSDATAMMFWLLLLTAAAIAIVIYRRKRRDIYKAYAAMPLGIPRYPLIGHGYGFAGTDEDRMNFLIKIGRVALQQKGFSSFWLGHKMYAAIAEPESLEVAAKACLEKDEGTMKYLRLVLGNGLIFAPVNIWRTRRKIMAPTFNMKNLQQFASIFDKQSSIMVELLSARAGQGDFSLWNYVTTYTFDSVCETVLGIKLNAQKHLHPFITSFDILIKILSQRMLSPWLYWDWVFRLTPLHKKFVEHTQYLYSFFDEILRDKRKQLAAGQVPDNDKKTFLDMMIESSGGVKGYSDIELREEVLSIVSAGTDTSAVGTAFTAVMLSRYPRVQDKVYEELREVFGDSDRPVTWEDLPKLNYLEVVIKESLRLYPPAPVVVRDVHETVVLPNGTKLVPGMALCFHLWATHRNTKYWGEDAEQFRPERFLERPLRHQAQFIPFSYSLRNCIGKNYAIMSTKTNLANLLRRYTVLPPTSVPADQLTQPLRVEWDVMMKHCEKFEVRLEHRKKTVDLDNNILLN